MYTLDTLIWLRVFTSVGEPGFWWWEVETVAEMVLADAGACTADDATKSNTVKFSCDAVKCAKSNFFKLDPTAACIAKEDGVSSGCANCFGQVSQCVVKNCAVKCLVDPTAPACQACGCEGGGGQHLREQRHLGLTEPANMQCVQGEVVPAQDVFSLPPTTTPLVVWLGDC